MYRREFLETAITTVASTAALLLAACSNGSGSNSASSASVTTGESSQTGASAEASSQDAPEKPKQTAGGAAIPSTITLTVGDASFNALLENTDAAAELVGMLPLELHLTEANGNEKYAALGTELTVDEVSPGVISTGDILLYGSDTLVVFYDTFVSADSYTRIARIGNTTGLAEALGAGDVDVAITSPDA